MYSPRLFAVQLVSHFSLSQITNLHRIAHQTRNGDGDIFLQTCAGLPASVNVHFTSVYELRTGVGQVVT